MSVNGVVGRVLRASTRGFDCGTHSRNIDNQHDFGAFVKAPIANNPGMYAIGLIYKIEIKDDQLISELVLGEAIPDTILRDQRANRMIPVEVKVLNIGYASNAAIVHSLPPRPPMTLSDVTLCSAEEVNAFVECRHRALDFFRLVLGASEVPTDDLLASAIQYAARHYDEGEARYRFLVECGRRVAQDLSNDLKRLNHILGLIHP